MIYERFRVYKLGIGLARFKVKSREDCTDHHCEMI